MNILVVSGGDHPYQETTPLLLGFLGEAGHKVTMTEDSSELTSPTLETYDVIIFNTRREGELTLSRDEQLFLSLFVGKGGGLIVVHIAGALPENWPQWHDLTGGGWVPGRSYHPEYSQYTVRIADRDHPCVNGISDFVTNDELYMDLAQQPDIDIFLTSEFKGQTHPLGWTRSYCDGRIMYTSLGHDGLSFKTPEFQKLILNGIEWTTQDHEMLHDPLASLRADEI